MDEARRLRAALDARIVNQSGEVDPYPLRRRLTYQRVLRRLGEHPSGGWVLKGGYLLEARLHPRARATRDLDLAIRLGDNDSVAVLLREALNHDPDGDHFTFTVSQPTELVADARGNRAWRVTVTAVLDSRTFASLRIDLVDRLDEIGDATEVLVVPPPVAGLAFGDALVTVVDIAQHAAEKFHALCTVYPDGRQNTRVKDLLDIVLMVEAGLLPHPALAARIRAVFGIRDGKPPPAALPSPPASWRADYATLASATEAQIADVEAAFTLASSVFAPHQLDTQSPHHRKI